MNQGYKLSFLTTVVARGALILSLSLLLVAPSFADQVAVSNIGESLDVNFNVVQFAFAQSFTTGNDEATLVSVTADAHSNSMGTSRMNLRADNGGLPGAFVKDLGTLSIPAGHSTPTFTPNFPVDLQPNTTYWLTLGEAGAGSGSFSWTGTTSTNQTSSLGWTIADQAMFSDDGGISWTPVDFGPPNESTRFSVQILEPASDSITFTYSGIVDGMASGGSPDPAPFQAFAGQTMTVTFTFDPNTPDAQNGANGVFNYFGAVTDLEVTVGANVYSDISGGSILVANSDDLNFDTYRVQANVTGPAVGGFSDIFLSLFFLDSTKTAFSSGALPLVQPNPDDFNTTEFRLSFVDNFDFGDVVVTDVACEPDCVTTIGSNLMVTRSQTDPVINSGPLSFGLTELPGDLDVTFLLGPGFPTGGGATGYGLDEVISTNIVFGDGIFTELVAFDFEIDAKGAVESLSATFAPINTPTVFEGPVVLNSPAFFTGTDIASGLEFAYTYGESTDSIEMMALLGDVNQDGVVNLLDVAPFIDLLSSGVFQLEADINEDGAVNLLDIDPFIVLLSGG